MLHLINDPHQIRTLHAFIPSPRAGRSDSRGYVFEDTSGFAALIPGLRRPADCHPAPASKGHRGNLPTRSLNKKSGHQAHFGNSARGLAHLWRHVGTTNVRPVTLSNQKARAIENAIITT